MKSQKMCLGYQNIGLVELETGRACDVFRRLGRCFNPLGPFNPFCCLTMAKFHPLQVPEGNSRYFSSILLHRLYSIVQMNLIGYNISFYIFCILFHFPRSRDEAREDISITNLIIGKSFSITLIIQSTIRTCMVQAFTFQVLCWLKAALLRL